MIILGAVLASALAVVLVLTFSSSGSSGPNPAACRAAMRDGFTYGMQHPDAPAKGRPAACDGVSDRDVQRFADQIMSDYLNGSS